jgi:hypothetical protein
MFDLIDRFSAYEEVARQRHGDLPEVA